MLEAQFGFVNKPQYQAVQNHPIGSKKQMIGKFGRGIDLNN
jgi:hypothetical protein